ncbi:DUF4270 family protein [Tenacibaculum sp. UWU-22]|uniref:DUF4270 family protein n=1 Tax=Tenacibaculum sp. UWU-22 TaxID=3234187 RepID=UPI0034DAF57A
MKKTAFISVILLLLGLVVSCEKDFKDIGTSVIKNGAFETKDTLLDINITPVDLASVKADGGITNASLGKYLLGIFNRPQYKKIEASVVSQLSYLPDLKVVDKTYGSDTTVVTKMDKAFIMLPYTATDTSSTSEKKYNIDVLGDPSTPASIKVYQNETYLNSLDPSNPSQPNSYESNYNYVDGDLLNEDANFTYTVPQNESSQDTIFIVERHLSTDEVFPTTVKLANAQPFMTIPLDKEKIKNLFLDKYESSEFESKEAFNNYFRGLKIEASGDNGALIPFDFANNQPTLEIYYTNTILKGGAVIDTITKNDSFPLWRLRNSIYKPTAGPTPDSGDFVIQGTAGTMANIDILQGTQLAQLKAKNWLINDASLIFYINKNKDTSNLPSRLLLYKNGTNNPSQIKDIIVEGESTFGGYLVRDDNNKADRYHFRITDYISDLLTGKSSYNPPLGLKVYNSTDTPSTTTVDTIVKSYNWNPKAITLYSNTSTNSIKKAQLKISYSIKK